MFNDLKNKLVHGWNLTRIIRLLLAGILIAQSIDNSEILFAALGGLLLFQAVFNYGCCSTGACGYPTGEPNSSGSAEDTTTYTEIK